jgi:hypothetical protein
MQVVVLIFIGCAALCGCSGARGNEESPQALSPTAVATVPRDSVPAPAAAAPREERRLVERDINADGIADYLVVITDRFDAAGALVSRTREEDFEADGVIDSRTTTVFR